MNIKDHPHQEHPSHEKHLPRLNRIKGQVEGITKMIQERRYCADILIQFRAVRSAIRSLELQILDLHLSNCINQAVASADPKSQKEKIDEIRDLIKRF